MERCGAVVKRRTRDREVPGSIPTNCKCCFLEQETLSTLLSTGFYPGKKRATWKISTRLLNVLPSINKVDYYYYYSQRAMTFIQRRLNVNASTLRRRCINVMCPLGFVIHQIHQPVYTQYYNHSTFTALLANSTDDILKYFFFLIFI